MTLKEHIQTCVLLGWYIILPELDTGVPFSSPVGVSVTVLVGLVPELVTLSFGQKAVE